MDAERLRKIDALICEKVMGWHLVDNDWVDEDDNLMANAEFILHDDQTWHPTTSWDAAGQVLVKFHHWVVAKNRDGTARCSLVVRGETYRTISVRAAATAPLAICTAALRALGVEVPES